MLATHKLDRSASAAAISGSLRVRAPSGMGTAPVQKPDVR
ncbi:unnamed protein product [Ixodes pacificus]